MPIAVLQLIHFSLSNPPNLIPATYQYFAQNSWIPQILPIGQEEGNGARHRWKSSKFLHVTHAMFVGYSLMLEIQVCLFYPDLLILGNETIYLYLALHSLHSATMPSSDSHSKSMRQHTRQVLHLWAPPRHWVQCHAQC